MGECPRGEFSVENVWGFGEKFSGRGVIFHGENDRENCPELVSGSPGVMIQATLVNIQTHADNPLYYKLS